MRAETCGEPLSLAHIPVDRVVRLVGLTDEQLAVSLDPLPDGSPVVIRYRIPHPCPSTHDVVDDVLAKLEAIAMDLFPAWLPSADVIDTSGDFDRRVVRELAHRKAAESAHFGPFLADMAEAALRGRAPDRRFGPEVRANGAGPGSSPTAIAVTVSCCGSDPAMASSTEDDQRRAAVAFEWLVDPGDVGVWLTAVRPAAGGQICDVAAVPCPATSTRSRATRAAEIPSPVDYPALAGLPHPASAAEQALERRLSRCEWATGRTWNQQYASHSLAPPIRVDLMWPAERCVVEIDGSDHRGILKYAADRRRDNGLMLDGFAVLRFTNDEIVDDLTGYSPSSKAC